MTHKIVCANDELGNVLLKLDKTDTLSVQAHRTQAGQYIVEWETVDEDNTGSSQPS